jgi:hypothetical protein
MINIKTLSTDNQSDSGVFTTSSRTNFNEDSNSLLDIDEDYLQSISTDNTDNELLRQSLEAVLMETLLELRLRRSNNHNTHITNKDKEQLLITRL